MNGSLERRHTGLLVAALTLLSVAGVTPAHADYLNGVVFYVPSYLTDYAQIAERYDLGLVGRENGADAAQVSALDPGFRWYVYNSLTDNYATPTDDEHQTLLATASALGIDPEEGYLHYWDDTVVTIEGTDVFVPGWGGGSATDPAQSRVPVYYSNMTRRATHFATPAATALHKAVMVDMAVDQPFPGTTLYADGIFFDNSPTRMWNTGVVVSGGHVRETPGHMLSGSTEFHEWHWSQNIGPYLTSLRDTLETSADWSPDGKRKEIMINVSNTWDDTFVTEERADIIFMEFQYGPVRNSGGGEVQAAYDRDLLAHLAGISSFYPAHIQTEASGYQGSYTQEEAMLGNLAWYLVTRTATSIFFQAGSFNTSSPQFDELTWIGAMDVADGQLGDAVGQPYVISSGVDPLGYNYEVMARDYENGLALVRHRGRYNQDISNATAVIIPLGTSVSPVSPDGTVGSAVSTWSLRNGEGALFLGGGGTGGGEDPPPDGEGPDPVTDLAWSFRVLATAPSHGSVGIPVGSEVKILFTDPLPAGAVPSGWLTVAGTASGLRTGDIYLEEDGQRLVFRPATPWVAGETVTITLSALANRAEGSYLDGNGDGLGSGLSEDEIQIVFQIQP